MSEFQVAGFPPEHASRFHDAQARYFRPGSSGSFSDHEEQELRSADTLLTLHGGHTAWLSLRGWINTELGFVVPVDESDACSDTAAACFNAAADRALEAGHMGQVAEAYMGIASTHVYRPWSKDEPMTDEAWVDYRKALADTADFVCAIDFEQVSPHEGQKLSRIRYELMALMGLNAVRGDRRKPVKDIGVSSTYRQRLYRDPSFVKNAPSQAWHVSGVQYRNSEWTERHRLAMLQGDERATLASTVSPVNLAHVIDDQTPTGINRMLALQARNLCELPINDDGKEKVAAVQRHLKQLDKKLR